MGSNPTDVGCDDICFVLFDDDLVFVLLLVLATFSFWLLLLLLWLFTFGAPLAVAGVLFGRCIRLCL